MNKMSHLTEEIQTCFNEQKLLDCTFEVVDSVGGSCSQTIGAHKLILAMNSPVFEAMFYGDLREQSTVKITDIKFDTFKKFLSCFYNVGPPDITSPQDAIDLYYAAQKYCYVKLIQIVERYMHGTCNRNTSLLYYEHAKLYNNKILEQTCLSVFVNDIHAVIQDEGFAEERFPDLGSIFDVKLLPESHEVTRCLTTQMDEINNEVDIQIKIKTALELTRTLLIYAKRVLNLTLPVNSVSSPITFFSCSLEKLERLEISTLSRIFYKANELCVKCSKRNEGWPNMSRLHQHDGIDCCFKNFPRTQKVLYDIIAQYGHTDLSKYSSNDIGLIYRIYKTKLNYKLLI